MPPPGGGFGGGGPSSPLSQLVASGYGEAAPAQNSAMLSPQRGMGNIGGGLPPRPGQRASSLSRGQQDGFGDQLQQQWSADSRQVQEKHLQQNDPNFNGPGRHKKAQGYKVSQNAGGNSSISLGWEQQENNGGAPQRCSSRGQSPGAFGGRPPAGGRQPSLDRGPPPTGGGGGSAGQRAESPYGGGGQGRGQRAPSPGMGGGMGGIMGSGYTSSRDASPAPGRGVPPPSSCGRGLAAGERASSRDRGGSQMAAAFGGGGAPPAPAYVAADGSGAYGSGRGAPYGNDYGGGGAHGAAPQHVGSNSYANGSNQNCGNFITDRKTTKVLQAPGGRSQISFG